jgi:short-subunit dehydrogenase
VASVAGTVVGPTSGPYAASKHAQVAFSRSLAAELRGSGIGVHLVNPGPVPTPGFPQRRALAGRVSRRLVVSPDDVAAAIVRALRTDRREVFVPSVYRLAAAAQGIAPGTLTRLAAVTRWGR